MFYKDDYLDVLDRVPKPVTLGGSGVKSKAGNSGKWDDIGRALLLAGATSLGGGNAGQALATGYGAYDQRRQQRAKSKIYERNFGFQNPDGALLDSDDYRLMSNMRNQEIENQLKQMNYELQKSKFGLDQDKFSLEYDFKNNYEGPYKQSQTNKNNMETKITPFEKLAKIKLQNAQTGYINDVKPGLADAQIKNYENQGNYRDNLTNLGYMNWDLRKYLAENPNVNVDPMDMMLMGQMGISLPEYVEMSKRLKSRPKFIPSTPRRGPVPLPNSIQGEGSGIPLPNPIQGEGSGIPLPNPIQGGLQGIDQLLDPIKNSVSSIGQMVGMPQLSPDGIAGMVNNTQRNPELSVLKDDQLREAWAKAQVKGDQNAVDIIESELKARGIN